MVEITCDSTLGILNIKPSGQSFQDIIETLKLNGATWNPTTKFWNKSISDLEDLENELLFEGESVEISELTRKQVEEYRESLKELQICHERRTVNFDLLNFPPLQGKHPFENYQRQDLGRAILRNRFLFNWEMGLGKSYALAALIENLRYYNLIDKCIIMSTGVGVYNLKDELCKFGKNISPDEILVINSVMNLDDRDIFNKEKFKYKILIMTYDTFKGLNDFYYDLVNRPKTLHSKIEEAETDLKEYIKTANASIKASNAYKVLTDRSEKDNFIKNALKEDKELEKKKKELSKLKEKMHPSRSIEYQQSFVPIKDWLDGHHGALFLDECHSLANPKSGRSKSINMNLFYFKYRYEFTGTLADKYEKLYEPLFILDRSLVDGKKYVDWLKSYNELGNRFSRYAVNPNKWDMEKLRVLNEKVINNYAAKRKMNECLDLPLNYDVPTINVDMSPLHRKIYEEFVKTELKLSEERKLVGEATVKDSIMNMFGIFQLACENVECIKDTPSFEKFDSQLQQMINDYDWFKDNAKVPVIEAVVEERVDEEDQRGIVWYYHPKTKDRLVKLLKKYNPIVIEAGLGPEAMNAEIKKFKDDQRHKIIIASINIMNTSVTLTECKWNLYVERTFNYTVYSQSRGRIFRPGQQTVCRTYMTCFNNSIDSLQLQNLQQKGMVIESLLNKNIVDQQMWKMIFNAKGNESW